MANKAEGGGKLVFKPGVVCSFMANLCETQDRESFQFSEVICVGQDLDNLAKSAEEMKDCDRLDLSTNGL